MWLLAETQTHKLHRPVTVVWAIGLAHTCGLCGRRWLNSQPCQRCRAGIDVWTLLSGTGSVDCETNVRAWTDGVSSCGCNSFPVLRPQVPCVTSTRRTHVGNAFAEPRWITAMAIGCGIAGWWGGLAFFASRAVILFSRPAAGSGVSRLCCDGIGPALLDRLDDDAAAMTVQGHTARKPAGLALCHNKTSQSSIANRSAKNTIAT